MRAHAVRPVKVEEGRVAPATLRRRPCHELDEGLGQLGVVALQAGLPVPTLHNNDKNKSCTRLAAKIPAFL
jgi:hypothetical protein